MRIAQLHGDGARAALPHLPPHLDAIYVMHADAGGNLQTPPPPAGRCDAASMLDVPWPAGQEVMKQQGAGTACHKCLCCSPPPHPTPRRSRQPRWIIVDGLQGGSGEAFDWGRLREQAAAFAPHSSHGWLLAGGLTPDSVAGERRPAGLL